jgi:HrpA-like RNA helicase
VKVVFATNVAETSITIPDVDTVVDSGFVKEIR